jgi:hypothetical protein
MLFKGLNRFPGKAKIFLLMKLGFMKLVNMECTLGGVLFTPRETPSTIKYHKLLLAPFPNITSFK